MISRRWFLRQTLLAAAASGCAPFAPALAAVKAPQPSGSPRDIGYRGIWFTLGQKSEFGDKYSGGLGTYTANHVPMAVYSRQTGKTFFVYGGARDGERHLLAMASYYDHQQHRLPRPVIVHDKGGVNDPHDNPSLCLDGEGFLWVFVSGRARARPGLIYRSTRPFSVDTFEFIAQREFTYPQPRWIQGHGFLLLFTKYTRGRELYYSTSRDGREWTPDRKFAGMGGHYQTSHQIGRRVITAFNFHPGGDVDKRTNLYFLQTDDFGATWKNARGETVTLPLSEAHNPALARDYQAEKQLIYIHDLDLDARGRPAILYHTSQDYRPGPGGDLRWWTVAHWLGDRWGYARVTPANHNYSTGSLYLETEPNWRIFGPTEKGPQPVGAGGEIGIWASAHAGRAWQRERVLTRRSPRNHNYVRRPVSADPGFYAFWCDGNPDAFSESRLYFCNRDGSRVWQMPAEMKSDFAEPLSRLEQ